jgi:competence protein ComEC
MEVYFLDVGQGTCQLLLLGGQRAIVIDCSGRTDTTLVQALNRYRVERIVRLLVSHNDDDHVGGATSILSQYEGQIDQIWFLRDESLLNTAFWRRIEQQLRDGVLSADQLHRLERDERPKILYSEPLYELTLVLYSPRFLENLIAEQRTDSNATSAILALKVGAQRVVFAGDSVVAQWRRLREDRGRSLACDVLAVPHHGGSIAAGNAYDDEWLYQEGVRPRYAVISVGSNNAHGHPRQEVIRTLRDVDATVLCTQITPQCHGNLDTLRPGVIQPHVVGRSSPRSTDHRSGRSGNVGCAGTVVALVSPESVRIDRLESHQRAVDNLVSMADGCPMCRP